LKVCLLIKAAVFEQKKRLDVSEISSPQHDGQGIFRCIKDIFSNFSPLNNRQKTFPNYLRGILIRGDFIEKDSILTKLS
jgi:hypothetical protein